MTFYLIIFLFVNANFSETVSQTSYADPCEITEVSYSKDLLPVLKTYCNNCHSKAFPMGNVNLEGYENVKKYADSGQLYGSINFDTGFVVMPPTGQKIPQCDIDKIKFWIEKGAMNN